jgi:putative addiction module killer protein
MKIKIEVLIDEKGDSPFKNWLATIKDQKIRQRILTRLDRLELGNFGDCKSVGKKVFELRLDFGAGYRIYFAQKDRTIVILILGGDKSSQKKDIQKAIILWEKYENYENNNT